MADLVPTIEDDEDIPGASDNSVSDDEFQPTRKRLKSSKSGGLDPTFDFGQFTKDTWAEKIQAEKQKKQLLLTKKKHSARTTVDSKIKSRIDKVTKSKFPPLNGEEIEIKSEPESSDDDGEDNENGVPHNGVNTDEEDDDSLESDNSMAGSSQAQGSKTKKLKKRNKNLEELDDIELSEDELQADELRVKGKQSKKDKKFKGGKRKAGIDDDDEVDEIYEKLEADPDQTFETDMTFQQLNLSRPLLKSITSLGFVHPTPIQAAAIPIALAGRDICGCAATGTGKTAAYILPVLERLLYKPKAVAVTRVLCLVPTRELGVQVYSVTNLLASFSSDITVGLAVGGMELQNQEAVLRLNPDIVIATPGRLIDHLGNTPSFTLDSIEILILDEADRMLDDWFAEQLKEIVRQCSPRRQTLLFSATMTDRVKDLATVSLKNPSKIFVDSNKQVAFNLKQQFVRIRNEADREAMLCSLVVRTFHGKTMVFVPTKKAAHRLHILLGLMGIRVGELHGDLTQPQRLEGLKKFQTSEVDVLIVTDVAARGLDIPGVQSVLNYTMPPTLEQYIHRCGRTARAGRSGVAVSLVGEQDRKVMKQVAKSATHPVKARIIPLDIIGKYREKVKALEPQIESILQEEEAEKCITKAEIEANKAIKMLEEKKAKKKNKKGGNKDSGDRIWFQSSKDRTKEKERLKGRLSGPDRKLKQEVEEDLKIKRLSEFQARQAKRNRRNKGKPSTNVPSSAVGNPSKKKKKSFFDSELTNTKKAREFRHQPKKPERKFNQKVNSKKSKKR